VNSAYSYERRATNELAIEGYGGTLITRKVWLTKSGHTEIEVLGPDDLDEFVDQLCDLTGDELDELGDRAGWSFQAPDFSVVKNEGE
jgi:hypothetical protein